MESKNIDIKTEEEFFKVRFSRNNKPFDWECAEHYGSIWMTYKDAKKAFDKLANPRQIGADSIEWVELTYFPDDADDEAIIEDWELSSQQKRFKEFAKTFVA